MKELLFIIILQIKKKIQHRINYNMNIYNQNNSYSINKHFKFFSSNKNTHSTFKLLYFPLD